MKAAFLVRTCLLCLLLLVKNQIWKRGDTQTLDILLASIILACVGAVIILWQLQ